MTATIHERDNMAWGIALTAVGDTEEEVNEAITDYYRTFHPGGYGTSFGPLRPRRGGGFEAYGSRARSCD